MSNIFELMILLEILTDLLVRLDIEYIAIKRSKNNRPMQPSEGGYFVKITVGADR